MSSKEIRRKFREFFEKNGHKWVTSSSLVPTDPSVLLTTAGMQQFKRYFTGELDPMKDFGSKNTASIQKSFRTSDIDGVGDESHLTFFEMLGNFSFGGYFKEGAIKYAHEFITSPEWMGLKIDYVSVFAGDHEVPADEESEKIWKSLGIKDVRKAGREDNFWGPTGSEGPCGPTAEIYIKNVAGKDIEVWNLVFNEFYCDKDKKLAPLKTPGVDTGMGLERLAMVVQKVPTLFDTDLFKSICERVEENTPLPDQRSKRIVADHIRSAVFMIADGVVPSNTDRGYVLRRLIRRITNPDKSQAPVAETVIENYEGFYRELKDKKNRILDEIRREEDKFRRTLCEGLKQFEKGMDPFTLHTTYGFPFDLTKDLARKMGKKINEKDFQEKFKKHQEISRAGVEKKFGGHGLVLNTGELKAGSGEEMNKVVRLHTATHLLQRALREVLGPDVRQAGSDITPERTRFDFTFQRKMAPEEIKKVEEIVNQKIKENLPVNFVELPKAEAEKIGALYFFKEKYPEKVKVYFVGKDLASAWSKEFCGGPHVGHTGEIGKFKITKEEAVGAGTRRIRGTVE